MALRSTATAWYRGPTLVEAIDGFLPPPSATDQPLRFPIQDVYKFDERRILAGRIESGRLKIGDTLVFSPGGRKAKVATIEAWPEDRRPNEAEAGRRYALHVTVDGQAADQVLEVPPEQIGIYRPDKPLMFDLNVKPRE